MSGRKSPAFSLFPKDLLVDTVLLSAEQFGCYIRLLCHAWIGPKGFDQGCLPDDETKLAGLAMVSPACWARIGAPVRALFETDTDQGALWSKRLLEELAKQKARSGKAADSANRRWHGSDSSPVGSKISTGGKMRSHRPSIAAEADANANADEVGRVFSRKREPEGETAAGFDPKPYLRAIDVLWPDGPRVRPVDPGRAEAALYAVWSRGQLVPALEFAAALWAWSLSEDWAEQGGRFVPLAEVWVDEMRWTKRPRRCPVAEGDLDGTARRLAAENATREPGANDDQEDAA